MTGTLTGSSGRNAASDTWKYIIDWLCNASGAAVATFAELGLGEVSGRLLSFETIPGLNGDKSTDCPTALYDLTITDEYGFDIAEGTLANRSASLAERANPVTEAWYCQEDLTVTIANAGNAKRGRIVVVFGKR